MQKFFVESRDIEQNDLFLTGENARHISYSLRMAPGEKVVVCDGRGNDCVCEITGITRDTVSLRVTERLLNTAEPPYKATLYQALAKGDKMDYVVQKATEFGAARIVPFESARCVARIRDGAAEKKTARWQKIAEEAAKQSGRGVIPEVCAPVTFAKALDMAKSDGGCAFICYENERSRSIAELAGKSAYSFFVGPEGGFDGSEVEAAAGAGIFPITLGPRILRCESASGYVLAALSCMNEFCRS